MPRPVAILYEHPEWFRPLFVELERREVPFERLHAAELTWDPASRTSPYGLVVNRMSPRHGHAGTPARSSTRSTISTTSSRSAHR